MKKSPVVLGIVGDTCSGKTTLARGVREILGRAQVATLNLDDYRRYTRRERIEQQLSPVHPDLYYLDIMEQHLALLRDGQPVLKPCYERANGEFGRPAYVEPRPFLVVEGLLGFHTQAARASYDMTVFAEPAQALLRQWQCDLETRVRGLGKEQADQELKSWRTDADAFVSPQGKWADMVVRFRPHAAADGRLDASLILRPTLPRPDLGRVLKVGEKGAVDLELDRDMGLPVDRLEISGAMDDGSALALEETLAVLAARRPDASAIGVVADAQGRTSRSHCLALVQLLMVYHLREVAAGHY